ncbi:MAG: Lysine-specific histone demethylase 1A [Marteilia pararefringens]
MTCFTQLFDDSQEYIADLGGHITYSGNSLDPLDIIIKQLNLKFKDRIEMDNEAILDVTSRIIPNSIVKSYISFMKAMLESYLIYCEKHNMHAISFRKFFESAIKKQHCTNLELDLEFTKEMYNFYSIGIKKLTMLKQLQREINSIKLELLSIEKSGVGKNVVEAYHSRKLRLELADKEKIYANLYYEFDKVNLSKNNLDNSKSDLIDLIDFEQIKIFLSILMSYELNGGFDFENVSPQFIGQTFFAETNVDCSGKEFMDCLLADQKTLNIKTACKVQSVCYMNNVNNPDLPSCRLSYRNLDNDDIEFIESDYVLTTIPLNVLKSNPSIFLPPLPDWKLEIINESQPLFTEKIIVFLQKRLWPNKKMKKVNSISAESSHGMGQIKLIFDKNMPVVEVLYRHHESKFADSFDKESILSHISSLIKTITRQNPIIKSSVFTNWRNDPFSLGSSSTMPVRCREIGPLTLGCPIKNSYGKNSLFFGGDSTSVNYFGRTRGAIESGLVQASEILNETYYGHY